MIDLPEEHGVTNVFVGTLGSTDFGIGCSSDFPTSCVWADCGLVRVNGAADHGRDGWNEGWKRDDVGTFSHDPISSLLSLSLLRNNTSIIYSIPTSSSSVVSPSTASTDRYLFFGFVVAGTRFNVEML